MHLVVVAHTIDGACDFLSSVVEAFARSHAVTDLHLIQREIAPGETDRLALLRAIEHAEILVGDEEIDAAGRIVCGGLIDGRCLPRSAVAQRSGMRGNGVGQGVVIRK